MRAWSNLSNLAIFLVKSKTKRIIKPTCYVDFKSTNIVNNSVKKNSKAVETTNCKSEQFKNSFFVKTVILWNLHEEIVCAESVESFKTAHSFVEIQN